MNTTRKALAIATLTVVAFSCGRSEPAATQSAQAPPKPAASTQQAKGRDVSTLRACDLVTGDELVKIVGATKLQLPPAPLAAGEPQGCMYLVLMPGDQSEYFHVDFSPADQTAAILSIATPADRGDKVDGPWDEAWYGPYALGTGKRLIALRRGDYALEVRNSSDKADRKKQLLDLAKLAVSRVK